MIANYLLIYVGAVLVSFSTYILAERERRGYVDKTDVIGMAFVSLVPFVNLVIAVICLIQFSYARITSAAESLPDRMFIKKGKDVS